jgi:hypothetical protein
VNYLTNPDADLDVFSGERHMPFEQRVDGGFKLRCVRCGLAGRRLYQDFDGALRFIARIVEQNRKLERPECEKK